MLLQIGEALFHFWVIGGLFYMFGFIFQTRLISSKEGHRQFWHMFHEHAKGKRYKEILLYLLALILVFVFWFYYIVSDLVEHNS